MEEVFKEGDWVEILDTSNIRQFNSKLIGQIIQLDDNGKGHYGIEYLNKGRDYIPFNNKYCTNFRKTDFKKVPDPNAPKEPEYEIY